MGIFDSLLGGGLGPGLWINIGLNRQGFDEGMGKVKADLTNWRNETNASTRDMASWGTAIGATVSPVLAVGAVVYSLDQKLGGLADQLKDVSYQTGLTTQKLQDLQWAATLSGTNFDRAIFSVGQLTLKMEEAADHTSAAYKAFRELGVNPEGRTPDEMIDAVALAFESIKDPADRARLGNELYNRSWREMLPFMHEYIENKQKIAALPDLSSEEISGLAITKSGWDAAAHSIDIYLGKFITLVNQNTKLKEPLSDLNNSLTAVGYTAKEIFPDIEENTKTLEELGKEAETAAQKIQDLRDKIEDLSWHQAESPANMAELQFQLDAADALNKQMQGMAGQTTEFGGPGIEYERRQLPEIDPLTGIKWNDHQLYLKFLEDVKKAKIDDTIAADKINAANHDQLKTTNELIDSKSDLAKLISTSAQVAIDTDTTILASLQTRVETTQTQYDKLNQLGLEFWSSQSALAQVDYQSIMGYAAEAANFAGSNPIIQKIVQLSASGYDIDPSPLPIITVPTLKAADFSKVLMKTQEISPPENTAGGSGSGTGTKGGGNVTTVNLYQTNYGVPDTGYATNKALGRLAQQQGASGL